MLVRMAGKTSFANTYLPATANRLVFVNADEIALELSDVNLSKPHRDLRAGRLMLQRIDALSNARVEFLIETTLASLAYAQRIPGWQRLGYVVVVIYLRLPNVETSILRVRRRVAAGGHDIPEPVIRRRFIKSLEYLDRHYKPIVDEWYVYESLEGGFKLAEAWDDT